MRVEVSDQLIKRLDKSSPVQGHRNMIPRHRGFWNIQDGVALAGRSPTALTRGVLSGILAVAVRDPAITAQRTMKQIEAPPPARPTSPGVADARIN